MSHLWGFIGMKLSESHSHSFGIHSFSYIKSRFSCRQTSDVAVAAGKDARSSRNQKTRTATGVAFPDGIYC